MKILLGDKGNIDFEDPVKMDDDQQKKFFTFLQNMFKVVKFERVDEFRTERIGDKFFMREWTFEEYANLLEIEDTDKVAEILGRSWMSVDIKRGGFIPYFLAWTSQKGKDPLKEDVKPLIKEFMKDHKELIENRSRKRKNIRKIKKEIESLGERIQVLNSKNRRKHLEKLKNFGQFTEDIDDFIKKEAKKLSNEIRKLEEEKNKLESALY